MKTQTFFRSCIAAALLLVAAACGDSTGPSYEDSMGPDDADDAGNATYYYLMSAFRGMNFGSPQLGLGAPPALARGRTLPADSRLQFDLSSPATIRAGLQAASAAGCSYTASGTNGDLFDPIDNNENHVPDDWSVKVTCVSHDSLGEVETRVETTHLTIRVKEHTDDLFGYDASVTTDDHEDYTDGDDEKQGWEQVHNVSVTATGATSKYRYHGWEDYLNEGVHDKWEGSYEVNLAFDPDNTITLGAPFLPDGELTITGEVQILDPDEGNMRYVLSTPEPWLYSNECAMGAEEQPFVGGTLLGLLNGNEEIGWSYTWGPCGAGNDFNVFGQDGIIIP